MAAMQSAPRARWRWFLRNHLLRLVVILIAILIEMGFTSAVPFSFKYLVDQALIKHNGAALARVLSLLGAGALLVTVMGLWRDRLYALVQADFIARLRQEMFVHLQRLALDFYARTKRLEIMLHFKRYLGWVESYATMLVSRALLPLLKVITSGILMYVVDWRLGLASSVLMPLTYVGPRRYGPRVTTEYTNRKIQEGATEDVVKQNVDAQPLVKAYNLQRKYLTDFDEKNQALTRINVLHAYYGALVRRTVGAGSLLGQVAVMGLGSYLVWNSKLSIGSLAAFQALFVGLNHALSDFMQNLPAMMQARDGMASIVKLLAERPLVADADDAQPCGPLTEAIVFKDVSFGYSADQTQLSGITFTIPRGRSVAVVGTSGSGKSTVLNMLERFYDARAGGIYIDGRDIRSLSQDSIRARIGMVFQDPALLEMSVAENIRCGKLDATEREVIAAARKAEVHSTIATLPNGYDTIVKEKTKLTQAQR
jgi:ATP-binding cassette, subfamily B, bacterial